MSSSPRVVVLSAYFKRAHGVEPTLRSISVQTFSDFEALAWDDCSPDQTWEALRDEARRLDDTRIQVYRHSENLGLYEGLNRAITGSKSEYVAIVGSGDACHPERLAKQVEALDADPEAVFCATQSRTTDPLTGRTFSDESFHGSVIYASDIREVVPFTHGSVMFRREALEAAGLYEPVFTWCSDWDLFFRLLADRHAVYLPEVLYERYAQADGASFHPQKSFEQIRFRHLVHIVEAEPKLRADLLAAAQEDLSAVLGPRRKQVIRDTWKRQVKLALMRRRAESRELGRLTDDEYGSSMLRDALTSVSVLVSYLPVGPSTLINGFRRAGRLFRQG